MCGRYKLPGDWQERVNDRMRFKGIGAAPPIAPEVRPSTWAPILRIDQDGSLVAEGRRWGFHRTFPDRAKPDKWIKREHFNAVGATIDKLPSFRKAFAAGQRCLIPMELWWEWPVIDGKKHRTRFYRKGQDVFMVAGLYETSKDNKTGEPVPTFTMLTVDPNAFLGTFHDRAPLVLDPGQYDTWLAGSPEEAKALAVAHPDSEGFTTAPETELP
jgi:putative SOS response-associated peptidase YedK